MTHTFDHYKRRIVQLITITQPVYDFLFYLQIIKFVFSIVFFIIGLGMVCQWFLVNSYVVVTVQATLWGLLFIGTSFGMYIRRSKPHSTAFYVTVYQASMIWILLTFLQFFLLSTWLDWDHPYDKEDSLPNKSSLRDFGSFLAVYSTYIFANILCILVLCESLIVHMYPESIY